MSENTNEPVTNTDITGIAAEAADQTESAPETASEERPGPLLFLPYPGWWPCWSEDGPSLAKTSSH